MSIKQQLKSYLNEMQYKWKYTFPKELIEEILTNPDKTIVQETNVILSELDEVIKKIRTIING